MTGECSVALLELALAGRLSGEPEESLHRHLGECEACTRALEQMAGGAAWCQEAASLLMRDDLDHAVPAREEWSNVDFTVEHLEPSDQPDVLGRLGGYDVLEIIGRGGTGVVLKGFDRELKRCVAIKVLAPHLAQSSLARKRFAREAQAAAAVVHPNVLAIHQVQPAGRLPFLVMPLVAGESLSGRLVAQGRLELKETLRIGMQAAAGLAAAHEQGLVHRDVKPANILLEKGVERAVLTDFGLARAADDVSMTRWGIIAGTPQYMSPEQARGEPLDGRSDLFSLGCVLYEMATGVSPFCADSTMATLRRLIDDPPPALASLNPELPPWFVGIVERLLEKDPSRRFGSAKEVSELLEGCLAHVQQPASVPLPAAVAVPAARRVSRLRNALLKGGIAMIATLGIGLLGLFLMQSTEPPDIAGQWSGEGWGQVVLTQTAAGEYAGTYGGAAGKEPGKMELKWSRIQRRFNGTWREGDDCFGELSLRLAGREIRGARTADPKAKIDPATPRLADLVWTPVETTSKHVSAEKAATPAVSPAAELKALQGQWKVVHVEQGKDASAAWGAIAGEGPPLDPVSTDRFVFDEQNDPPLRLVRPARGFLSTGTELNFHSPPCVQGFYYRIDPAKSPATIDFLAIRRSRTGLALGQGVVASGIYSIENDRLRICLRRALPEVTSDQRPKEFAVDPSSADVLFVFNRYPPAADEKAIQREWTLVSCAVDGKTDAETKAHTATGTFRFLHDNYFYSEIAGSDLAVHSRMYGVYFLDSATQPKAITFYRYLDNRGLDKNGDPGIYAIEGDRLTIAFRQGGPRPGKLESEPGSGVTLLVLKESAPKAKPQATRPGPQRLRRFDPGMRVGTIACSPDGKLIAVGNDQPSMIMMGAGRSKAADNWQPSVRILEADTGKPVASLKLTTSEEDAVLAATERVSHFEVKALAFSPDGNVVAVGTDIGQVKLYGAWTGELVRSLDDEKAKLADKETPESWQSLRRAMGSVASLAFSPDGSLLATCGGSFADFSERFGGVLRLGFRTTGPGRLKVWDVKTGTLEHDLAGHNNEANAVCFSPDGQWLASAGRWLKDRDWGNGMILWNGHTGTQIRSFRTTASGGTRSVAFSPDGKLLAIGTLRFDDSKAKDPATSGVLLVQVSTGIEDWLVTVPGWAKPMAFLPDGKSLAALCGGRSIRFLETEAGQMRHEIPPADSSQGVRWNDFAIAPQVHRLALGGVTKDKQGCVEVWGFDAVPAIPPKPR